MFEFDDAEGEWRGLLKRLVEEAVDRGHLHRDLDID